MEKHNIDIWNSKLSIKLKMEMSVLLIRLIIEGFTLYIGLKILPQALWN